MDLVRQATMQVSDDLMKERNRELKYQASRSPAPYSHGLICSVHFHRLLFRCPASLGSLAFFTDMVHGPDKAPLASTSILLPVEVQIPSSKAVS